MSSASHPQSPSDDSFATDFIKQKHRVDSLMQKTEKNLEKRSRQFALEEDQEQHNTHALLNATTSSENSSAAATSTNQQNFNNLFRDIHHNLTFLHNSDWPALKNHIISNDASHLLTFTSKIDERLQNLEGNIKLIRMGMGIFFDSEEREEHLRNNPGTAHSPMEEDEKEKHVNALTESVVSENHELKSQLRVLMQREMQLETRIEVLSGQLQERVKKEATTASLSTGGVSAFSSLEPTLISVESPMPMGDMPFDPQESNDDSILDTDTTLQIDSRGHSPPVETPATPKDSNRSSSSSLSTSRVPLPNLTKVSTMESVQMDSVQNSLPFAYYNELKQLHNKLGRIEHVCKTDIYEKLRIVCNRLNFFQHHRPKSLDGKRVKGPRGQNLTFVLLQVFGSNVLWTAKPSSMQGVMTMFLHALRRCLGNYSGYENNGEAGTYLCVFSSNTNAVKFIRDLQINLLSLPYPESMLSHPLCAMERVVPDDEAPVASNARATAERAHARAAQIKMPPSPVTVFNGLRVSAVVHSSDHMTRTKNVHTLRDEYSSADIQLASRVLNVLWPGQVVAVSETAQLIEEQCGSNPDALGVQLVEPVRTSIDFAKIVQVDIPSLAARSRVNQRDIMNLPFGEEFSDSVSTILDDTTKRVKALNKELKATQYRMNLELELESLKKSDELRSQNAGDGEIKQVQKVQIRQQLVVDNVMDKLLRKLDALHHFVNDTEQLFVQNDAVAIMDKLHHRQHISLDKLQQEISRLKNLTTTQQHGQRKRSKSKLKQSGTSSNSKTTSGTKTASKGSGQSPLLPKAFTYDERLLQEDDSLLPPSLSPQNSNGLGSRKRLVPISPASPRGASNGNGRSVASHGTNKRKAPIMSKPPHRPKALKKI